MREKKVTYSHGDLSRTRSPSLGVAFVGTCVSCFLRFLLAKCDWAKDKKCLSLDAPLRYQFLVHALSVRISITLLSTWDIDRDVKMSIRKIENCACITLARWKPSQSKAIRSFSLSRPCSSVRVERKTFVWVTIQGVWIQREKKLHTFFCVLSTFSNPTRHVHTHVRDWENLRKSPSRLERPLPTHTTYLRTPNSTNLFHICICKKCEELRGTLYVWGGSPYPGSKWSLCVKMFFFSVWISPKPKRARKLKVSVENLIVYYLSRVWRFTTPKIYTHTYIHTHILNTRWESFSWFC